MEKENIPTGKLILQCFRAVLIGFMVLVLLVIVPLWLWLSLDEWKQERKLPEVRELAESYIAQQYPGNDFEITDLYHHWYDVAFYAEVRSKTSADTFFTVAFGNDPVEFLFDTYQWDVLEGGNVRRRVWEEYNAAVQEILGAQFPELELEANFRGAEGSPSTGEKPEAELGIVWELDRQYDVSALGDQAGVVIVRFDNTKGKWPPERRREVLRHMAQTLEDAGMGFFALDVMLAEELYYGSPTYHFAERILKSELN